MAKKPGAKKPAANPDSAAKKAAQPKAGAGAAPKVIKPGIAEKKSNLNLGSDDDEP
jgi:hypothetical protein